ncbi:hypothetical protein PoB_000622900 [Plakobranchus ocellatus]|uniref:Uncharacterized protein n=1 Tax=Plakobranchus ocellatus TaxID=259542 RepID=A0AAV3Y9T7_9GAST|nr:hypothetical protein PoB_000622900 [Plakobranchus ocellatus]
MYIKTPRPLIGLVVRGENSSIIILSICLGFVTTPLYFWLNLYWTTTTADVTGVTFQAASLQDLLHACLIRHASFTACARVDHKNLHAWFGFAEEASWIMSFLC